MTKPNFIFLFFLFLFSVSAVSAQVKKIDIGLLDRQTVENGACGTSLRFAGRKSEIFVSSAEGTLMIIDGKLVKFKSAGSTLKGDAALKKGQTFTDTFTSNGIGLVIKFTVAGFEDDVTKYRAVMTMTKGKNKRVLNAEGWSGC